MTSINPDHHAKFELVNAIVRGGQLLYVGMTSHPGYRFEQHQSEKAWWGEVVDVKLQHYLTREMARVAEILAIRTENPLHNIADRGWPIRQDASNQPMWRDPGSIVDWFNANHTVNDIVTWGGWGKSSLRALSINDLSNCTPFQAWMKVGGWSNIGHAERVARQWKLSGQLPLVVNASRRDQRRDQKP